MGKRRRGRERKNKKLDRVPRTLSSISYQKPLEIDRRRKEKRERKRETAKRRTIVRGKREKKATAHSFFGRVSGPGERKKKGGGRKKQEGGKAGRSPWLSRPIHLYEREGKEREGGWS